MTEGATKRKFWVRRPGRGAPVEMTAAELSAAAGRGDLPAGTLVAPFGTKEWLPPERFDLGASPASGDDDDGASAGAEVVASFEVVGSIGSEQAAPPEAPDPPPPPPATVDPARVRHPRLLLSVLGIVGALFVSGAVALFAWFRLGYARGTVLEHLPADCRRFEYVDLAAIDGAAAFESIREPREAAASTWLEDLDEDDGQRPAITAEPRGRSGALGIVRKLSLRPYGDVREVALCETREGDETARVVVIGGVFRGRDVLTAIREGLARRPPKAGAPLPPIVDEGGRRVLHLDDGQTITLVTGQVVIIAPPATTARHLSARPVARANAIDPRDLYVRRIYGRAGEVTEEERASLRGNKVAVLRTTQQRRVGAGAAGDTGEAKLLRDALSTTAARFRRIDGLDAIADAYDSADLQSLGDETRLEIVFDQKALGRAARGFLDAERKGRRAYVAAVQGAPATEILKRAITPGLDAFGLELAPW